MRFEIELARHRKSTHIRWKDGGSKEKYEEREVNREGDKFQVAEVLHTILQ